MTCPQEESVEYEDIGIGVRLTDRKDLGAYVIRDYAIFHHQVTQENQIRETSSDCIMHGCARILNHIFSINNPELYLKCALPNRVYLPSLTQVRSNALVFWFAFHYQQMN